MINIEELRSYNKAENIAVTEHARIRLVERDITMDDIIHGIKTGEIIEQYEKDMPFPSCLILGATVYNKYIHIVVSLSESIIHLITSYYPSQDKWERDLKTRKRC